MSHYFLTVNQYVKDVEGTSYEPFTGESITDPTQYRSLPDIIEMSKRGINVDASHLFSYDSDTFGDDIPEPISIIDLSDLTAIEDEKNFRKNLESEEKAHKLAAEGKSTVTPLDNTVPIDNEQTTS